MSMQRNQSSPSLQELIDSYNDEMLRYSQRAKQTQPTELQTGEAAQESGEEEIERARTERDYWLARGKQGLQRMPPVGVQNPPAWSANPQPGTVPAAPQPSAAGVREAAEIERDDGEFAIERSITERRYWLGEGKWGVPPTSPAPPALTLPRPRPEAHEPLYRPGSNMPRPEPHEPLDRPDWAGGKAGTFTKPAAPAAAQAGNGQQEEWLRELQDGLQEVTQGIAELEQSLRELRRGEAEYRRALTESEQWRQSSAPGGGFAPPAQSDAPTPSTGGVAAAPGSNANAPIAAISSDDRTAQSQQSSPGEGRGMGYLQVGAYTARQTNPVPNARVTVFSPESEGGGVFATAQTNDDGKAPLLLLPVGRGAPGSLEPPFAIYDVSVEADGFYPRNDLRAQMFDGVAAQLWVELTPLPDSAWTPIQPRRGEQ